MSLEIPKPVSSELEFGTFSKTYWTPLEWDLWETLNDFAPKSVSVSSSVSMALQVSVTKGLFPDTIDPSAVT